MQLVFIHGSGGSELVWQYQTDHFRDAVAVTLPGRPDGEPLKTVPEASRWLKEQADAQGWQDLVLIGHSYGGGIALQYALDYPDDVRAVVTVGSGGRLRVHPDTLAFMKDLIDDPSGYPASLDESYEKVAPEFASRLRARAIAQGPAAAYYDLMACDQFDVMERLGEIKAPLHAIVGSEDVMTPPKYSEFMCRSLPDASMTVIDGGTHFVFAEQPDAVNQAIEAFLDRLN